MPFSSVARHAVAWLLVILLVPALAPAQGDPVANFINQAASIWTDGGDEPLATYIAEHPILVGAAVAQLLDVAIEVGDTGNTKDEKENIDFAELVASLYREKTGSSAPLDLVKTCRSWDRASRDRRANAKNLEAEATEARKAGDLPKAEKLLLQAQAIYEEIGDKHSRAVVFGSLGVVYWYARDFDVVIGHYRNALQARREVEDRILEGRTLNGLGSAHLENGDYPAAAEFYSEAVELRRKTGDLGGLGTSLTYLGNLYLQLGSPVDARSRLQEAVPVLEQVGNDRLLVDNLTVVGNLYSEMEQPAAANQAYHRAAEIAASTGQPVKEAVCRMYLGANYRLAGRYNESLVELDAAQKLLDQNPDPAQAAVLHRERGLSYGAIGELDRARDDLLECLKITAEFENPYEQIQALTNIGLLYQRLGAFERGLESAARARELAEKAGLFRLVRQADARSAELEWLSGRPEKSLFYWQRALERDRQDQAEALVTYDEIGLATAKAGLGRNAEARAEFRKVLRKARELESADLESAAHLGIAHTFEDTNPDSARHHYERGLTITDRTRASVGAAEIRTGFFSGERRHYYEEVARYYASLDHGDGGRVWSSRAFRTVERAKARGLLDLMAQTIVSQSTPQEDALLDSLYGLDESQTAARAQIEKRYVAIRDQRVRSSMGELSQESGLADIEQVQAALPKGTVLLEYALGDTSSLLWAIDRKAHSLYELPDRKTIGVQVEWMRDAIAQPGVGDATLRQTAWNLYGLLVEPAGKHLEKAKTLVIVPDGVLFGVPFEVLLTEEPDGNRDWKDHPFLARSFEIVYEPSASVFLKLEKGNGLRKYGEELLALGDPDFSRLARGAGASTDLAPLPHTRSEVLNLSSRIKDKEKKVLLGRDANEALLKENLRASKPRILHLATHGLINPLEPASSAVALGAGDGSGEDGYLHTLEILSLPLEVGLVVLSACETGRGKVGRGEGVVGLSRAFIASGAGGVVASLWSVSDESTAQLMDKFYERMFRKKHPAGKALNEARLAMMKDEDFAHPFYWSPFIVIGTQRSPW